MTDDEQDRMASDLMRNLDPYGDFLPRAGTQEEIRNHYAPIFQQLREAEERLEQWTAAFTNPEVLANATIDAVSQWKRDSDALRRSDYDVTLCDKCQRPVVTIPDGMPVYGCGDCEPVEAARRCEG